MSQILTISRSNFRNLGKSFPPRKTSSSKKVVLGVSNFKTAIFFLFFSIIFLGIFYLYQVNDLTSKGYEAEEIERQIEDLQKENEKNRIREVELRSMYNIEEETEELNLISANNVQYLELGGPVAMK